MKFPHHALLPHVAEVLSASEGPQTSGPCLKDFPLRNFQRLPEDKDISLSLEEMTAIWGGDRTALVRLAQKVALNSRIISIQLEPEEIAAAQREDSEAIKSAT